MGQENEEEAELIATIQHDHSEMKQWYNSTPEAKSALYSKYGSSYPSFWRDVLAWSRWKQSQKLFLKSMELKEKKERERRITASNGNSNGNSANANVNAIGANSCVNTVASGTGNDNGTRIKRRSRFVPPLQLFHVLQGWLDYI